MAMADCYLGAGRMERARNALERALPLLSHDSPEARETWALAHLRLGAVKSKLGAPEYMEHFHHYLSAHPSLVGPTGGQQAQQQLDDPHVRMAILAIAQEDRLRGEHHRATLILSLLGTAFGPVCSHHDSGLG